MRILGFERHWPKLDKDTFTTFRFPRRDRDWFAGETVQIVVQPRRKGGGETCCIAQIIAKEPRYMLAPRDKKNRKLLLSGEEAIEDGFFDWRSMWEWLRKHYDIDRLVDEPMNKLTLQKVKE